MRILLHAGAHPTDEDKLFASLDANVPLMSKKNIALPRIHSYRRSLRQAMIAVAKKQATPSMRQDLLTGILENAPDTTQTIILSLPMFFGSPRESVQADKLFPDAVKHLERFSEIFHKDQVELFFSIRNPATFIPASMSVAQTANMNDILRGSNYAALRWSELFARVRAEMPRVPITAWCDEDTPFIWSNILRAFMDVPQNQPVSNGYAIFAQILTTDGFERFKTYMQTHQGMTPAQHRKVMYAFAAKFARPDVIAQEIENTPWTQETIDLLTERYDMDVDRIVAMPGVTFIEP